MINKVGVLIPTFGDSAKRLVPLLETINRFTEGYNYQIFVRDDGTPNLELVAMAEFVTKQAGGIYIHGEKWGQIWGNHDALGWAAIKEGCDLLVFANDDCLFSSNWLYPILHFYEWNENLKLGMVSGPILEAWELTIDGRIPSDLEFYSEDFDVWSDHGCVLREHVIFDEEAFDRYREDNRLHSVANFIPMGPIVEKRYNLKHPVPLTGGVGPYFTIRTDVFKEINGFEKCEFTADYEALIGAKVWEAGYKCCLIPAPPAYHARGVGSHLSIGDSEKGGDFREESEDYKPWTETGSQRLEERWGVKTTEEVVKRIEREYQNDASEPLANSRFIRYQNSEFPINIEYDKLTEINLGAIHWRDKEQTSRMSWVASHCQGDVLDVGCANGGLLTFLEKVERSYSSYTGVDLDRVRIDEAVRSREGNVRFFVMDATYGLPFQDFEFDTSVCCDALEHIPRKIGINLVRELGRVARTRIILTFPSSKEYIENVDHVWDSSLDEVQKFLQPMEEEWEINTTSVGNFALIYLDRRK